MMRAAPSPRPRPVPGSPMQSLQRLHPAASRLRRLGAIALLALGGCASSGTSGDRPLPVLNTERVAAIVASPDRSAADRNTDARRKPVELLTFIGIRPGMTVLDVSAGGGYTSELLARAVGPTGRVYAQSAPPDPSRAPPAVPEGGAMSAPAPVRRTSAMAIAERARNPAAANLAPVMQPYDHPAPADLSTNAFDLVTLMFNYHDFGHMGIDRATMNASIFAALKPGGVYVVADHAGRDGTGITESGTLHRVEEDFVVREVEAAGFRLKERGAFLRNPADPRDRESPEAPQAKDEFVLKFVRP